MEKAVCVCVCVCVEKYNRLAMPSIVLPNNGRESFTFSLDYSHLF